MFWAALCLGKSLMTLWLLQTQTLETFVLVKSVAAINVLAAVVTVAAAAVVARQEGPRPARPPQPVPTRPPASLTPPTYACGKGPRTAPAAPENPGQVSPERACAG